MTIEKLLEELKKQHESLGISINMIERIVATDSHSDRQEAIVKSVFGIRKYEKKALDPGKPKRKPYTRKKPFVFTKARRENIKKAAKALHEKYYAKKDKKDKKAKKRVYRWTPGRLQHVQNMREKARARKANKDMEKAFGNYEVNNTI
jgi:hypothetical protein